MKKCISIMLAMLMIITASISTATVAFAAADAWDGSTVAKAFEGGTGTESDPYLIATAAQLVFLRNLVNTGDSSYNQSYKDTYGESLTGAIVYDNVTSQTHKRLSGKYFKLTNDIDMGNNNIDRGIGYSNDKDYTFTFAGNFDGDGHIIKNLVVAPASATYAIALFGLTEDATIKNVGIENAVITVNHNGVYFGHGVLIGKAYGTLNLDNCFVKNSKVENKVGTITENVGLGILTGMIGTDSIVNTTNDARYKINNCYAVNNEIAYTGTATGEQKLKKTSVFGNTKGYGIDINNCYAVNDESTSKGGLKITNIRTIKDSSRTNYIFSCDADTSNTGYTSKGSNCYVVGGKQVSAVDYLKQGAAFTIVASDELKTLPADLNSQNAYETKYADVLNSGYPILKWEYERVCNPYKADNLKYTSNGSEVTEIQAGAVLTTADITKTTSIAKGDKKGIFAYFDASGNLVTCALVDITDSSFDSAETVNFSVNMQLPTEDKFTGGSLRIFFWDNVDGSLKPANRDVIIP